MELDVHLKREAGEPWGFRLIGGKDFNMPLTVVKVVPDSPADKADLHNGDSICQIDSQDTSGMSHDTAKLAVDDAAETLSLAVKRGLYDPVLDDYDPIYEPIDQDDLDRASQPTEVDPFAIPIEASTPYPEEHLRKLETPSLDTSGLSMPRSSTASPFLLPTKPYRPFSTEPLAEVPDIENPIILNPDYQDTFLSYDNEELPPETRFKLPISVQYVPDNTQMEGKQQKRVQGKTGVKFTDDSSKKDVTFEERVIKETKLSEEMQHKTMVDEMKFMEQMKKDIDLDKIEMTAISLVDESIEAAVTVAGEIKKEIDIVLSESESSTVKSEVNTTVSTKESKSKQEAVSETLLTETKELVELIDKTTENILVHNGQKSEVNVSKEVAKIESLETAEKDTDEKRQSTKQEMEEIIIAGNVRKTSEALLKQTESLQSADSKQVVKSKATTESQNKVKISQQNTVAKESMKAESNIQSEARNESVQKESINATRTRESKSRTDFTTSSKQRAYNIGLKTIPYIKGTIHSSYHYNLLLQTFFVHLTDVMVALTSFLLTQPALKDESEEVSQTTTHTKDSQEQRVSKKSVINERQNLLNEAVTEKIEVKKDVVESKSEANMKSKLQDAVATQAVITQNITKQKDISYSETDDQVDQLALEESRRISGAKMAQRTEKKSEELTQKMSAVISEFETKAGIEDTVEMRDKRSRSRSRIADEVAKESDPLEWLSKVDLQQTQEVSEQRSESKTSTSTIEITETGKTESEHKSEKKSSKSKGDKQMYVAFVESHVFTNKDVVFEDQIEFSETSSVQSADEINTAIQANEIIATEKVSFQSNEITDQKAESKFEKSREQTMVSTQSETVKMASEVKTMPTKTAASECSAIVESRIEESSDIQAINAKNKSVHVSEEVKSEKIESKEIMNSEFKSSLEQKTVEVIEGASSQKISTEVIETKKELSSETEIVKAIGETIQVEETKAVLEDVCEIEALEIGSASLVQDTAVQNVAIQEIVEAVAHAQEIQAEITNVEQKVDVKQEDLALVVSEKTEVLLTDTSHEVAIQEITKEEAKAIVQESVLESAIETIKEDKTETKIEEVETKNEVQEISAKFIVTLPSENAPTVQEASDDLKIVKEQIVEVKQGLKITEQSESSLNRYSEVIETENSFTSTAQSTMQSLQTQEIIQESSFTAKSSMETKKSSLHLDLVDQNQLQIQSSSPSDPASTINTPTPSTVPPTPLTDEYVFKLQIPLPKCMNPILKEESPEPVDEDPHIVKKKLIPHIESTLESPIIYDPPLPTPPADKVISPVYTKPGLRGGSDRREFVKKEEIREIGRRSCLLASAIDETIKNIEEYKEEVGIETRKHEDTEITFNVTFNKTKKIDSRSDTKTVQNGITDTNEIKPVISNGYAKVDTNTDTSMENYEEEWNSIQEKVKKSNQHVNELSNSTEKIERQSTENTFKISSTEPNEKKTDIAAVIENTALLKSLETKQCEDIGINTSVELLNGHDKPQTEISNNIDVTFNIDTKYKIEKREPLEGYRPVQFDPEELKAIKRNLQSIHLQVQPPMERSTTPSYVDATGALLGTHQGIIDGLDEATVDAEIAKELGKPGITEEKIAELMSGESEMLREAHVMGLSRVLTSHMHRSDDDSSVDFKKIKPIIESLKNSEVLKALNDELIRKREEKKKEEKKWTTFLQKPARPVPRAKFGYYGYTDAEEDIEKPYKVQIVKQPKPKIAPDYKPEDFETGLLPWEERAQNEPSPPPVDAEDPILIPEELPEFLEAVDPLPESEVPDLEETGIPLPEPEPETVEETLPTEEGEENTEDQEEQPEESQEVAIEEAKVVEEMDQNKLAEQLLSGVQSMVDPSASIDQQLAQMRAQVAALAQLPGFIQQTLDLVTKQLSQLTQQDTAQIESSQAETQIEVRAKSQEHTEVTETQTNGEVTEMAEENEQNISEETNTVEIVEIEESKTTLTQDEMEKLRKEEEEMLDEQRRIEKQKKELMEQMRLEQESRQIKQRPTPRVGKPKQVFGNPEPQDRPVVLPGGRRWRKPEDAYNEQFIAETLSSQAELIQGKAMGINFMKYEKPPVSLDHLQQSETYKMIHNMEQAPPKRVEMRTPVIAEADYREKCRSMTPSGRMDYPQQVHP